MNEEEKANESNGCSIPSVSVDRRGESGGLDERRAAERLARTLYQGDPDAYVVQLDDGSYVTRTHASRRRGPAAPDGRGDRR